MAQKETILLGRITKVHGFEGAVTVKLEKNFSENIPQPESVFIEIDGRPVPFFIGYIEQVRPDTAHLKFLDYDSVEKVREFCGCNVFLTDIWSPETSTPDHQNIKGYRIESHENIFLGTVSEVIKNPSQWLLRLTADKGKEILVPLHEDLVIEIDDKLKIIKMIIPEGLTDIN